MKYQLLNEIKPDYSTIETILTNRGIAREDVFKYLNTTDEDINPPELLNADRLFSAANQVMLAIDDKKKCLVVVDSDCDGFTSAAVLINYLWDVDSEWTENYVDFVLHKGKQHGLSDIEVSDEYSLVIVPDAGSNDYEEHAALLARGIRVIVLDHHEAEEISDKAIIINNQLSDYPNKQLSGVGVTWQFCRYLDSQLNTNYADEYLDLVALGMDADMMSLRSIETKHLINKGLEKNRLRNPFFYSMADKNSYSLGGELTPIGVAFYIAPYVNAMVRSGTMEEKEVLFKSMLKFEAFKRIPSTKRGHKPGEEERVVDQALRIVTNVKNRQTKAQTEGMDKFEGMIRTQNLLDNKVLLLLCEPGSVSNNIAGLVANKFMSKFQRHTAILFRTIGEDGKTIWQGSARGYGKSIHNDFKALCSSTGLVEYAEGHANAFGLGIRDENINKFIYKTNELLADDTGEPTYFVDYIFYASNIDGYSILDISRLNHLWGQDMPEALVAVRGLKITGSMLTLMSPDKNPTLKITIPTTDGSVAILKFKSSQEEYDKLYSRDGYNEIDLVGTCNSNEWMGNITPQIFIKDYVITDSNNYYF